MSELEGELKNETIELNKELISQSLAEQENKPKIQELINEEEFKDKKSKKKAYFNKYN